MQLLWRDKTCSSNSSCSWSHLPEKGTAHCSNEVVPRGYSCSSEIPFTQHTQLNVKPRSIFLEYLLKKYHCIVTLAPLCCSLASQQSTAMLELVTFLPILLRVTLFHLAITAKHVVWHHPFFWNISHDRNVEKSKVSWCLTIWDLFPTLSLPIWPRHTIPFLWAYELSSVKGWC